MWLVVAIRGSTSVEQLEDKTRIIRKQQQPKHFTQASSLSLTGAKLLGDTDEVWFTFVSLIIPLWRVKIPQRSG